MSLSYKNLSKQPKVFNRLCGVTTSEFNTILHSIKDSWEALEKSKKAEGRPSHLEGLEDKLLCLLLYYRCYITHIFLGYLFNLDASNICRNIGKMEKIVAKKIHIKKDRSLTYNKVLELIVDVTESPTERPKKKSKQKAKYSGKKKKHTNKTEIIIDKNTKQIIGVSKSYGGRVHDFKIRKQEKPLPLFPKKLVDSGYQGLQKKQSKVVLPFKRKKKTLLSLEEKEHNKCLSSKRVVVEHIIRNIKIFDCNERPI